MQIGLRSLHKLYVTSAYTRVTMTLETQSVTLALALALALAMQSQPGISAIDCTA